MFYKKFGKRIFDISLSLLGIFFLSPIFLILSIIIKTTSEGPIIFKQKRVGKDGKIFTFYKFRTMLKNAQDLKNKYQGLNEADGPVFKIRNDPRFTKFGKILSYTGFDELPQLINILKGEMSFVGPRPFPIEEENKISKVWQEKRRLIKPGLVSPWVTSGSKHDSFKKWMESDLNYINNYSLAEDFRILYKSALLAINLLKDITIRKVMPLFSTFNLN